MAHLNLSPAKLSRQGTDPDTVDFSIFQKLLGNRARPEPKWVAALTGVRKTTATNALLEKNQNYPMEKTIHDTLQATCRTYYAQFPAPLELYAITRIVKPEHIVESGVSSGISSAHFLMALKRNRRGILHSIDYPTYSATLKRSKGEISWTIPYGKDSGWAVQENLKKRWDLQKGRSEELLPDLLRKIGTVNIFCHDSPWTPRHLGFELKTAQQNLKSGSIFIADNSSWNPAAVEKLASAYSTSVIHRRGSDLIGIRIP